MLVDQQTCSMWRYAGALPTEVDSAIVTMGEGWTPLNDAPRTAERIGCTSLHIKDEAQNPTGTFKDRSASYAVTRLRERRARGVVLNSTGNAGASFAVYAARAGLRCVAIVPEDVLDGNLLQMQACGTEIHRLADWSGAAALSRELARDYAFVDVSAGQTPYRRKAKSTIGYEIAEQLGWRLPDVLCFPTGGGTAVLAIRDAFEALLSSGDVVGRQPRLVLSQYAGCAPIAAAYAEGLDAMAPWLTIDTPRGGMRTPAPASGSDVLAALGGGAAFAVEPERAWSCVRELAADDGLTVGLETGSALEALARARSTGIISRESSVVVVNTSTLLKSDPAYTLQGERSAGKTAQAGG